MLSLSWVPPLTSNGAVISYTVYCDELPDNFDSFGSGSGETEDLVYSLDISNSTLSMTLSGNENGTLFRDLMPYTFYGCYVSANTSAGEGNFSTRVVGRTDESSELKCICVCNILNLLLILQFHMMLLAVSESIP